MKPTMAAVRRGGAPMQAVIPVSEGSLRIVALEYAV
jgi:hypothetical protein